MNGKDMFTKIVITTIREKRIELGYTQDRVAEMIDGDVKHYSKIENGVKSPGSYTLFKIFIALQIDSHDITLEYLRLTKILQA